MNEAVRLGAVFAGCTTAVACVLALWGRLTAVDLLASVAAVAVAAAFGAVAGHSHVRLSGAAAICLHALLLWLEGVLLARVLPRRIHWAALGAALVRALSMITLHRRALRKRHDA